MLPRGSSCSRDRAAAREERDGSKFIAVLIFPWQHPSIGISLRIAVAYLKILGRFFMVEFENVLSNYVVTKRAYPLVPGKNLTPALQSIRQEIPDLLRKYVESSPFSSNDFYIRGSAGMPNRSFAHVPWVAIFKQTITRSAQRGYYIVMLFSEDMSSLSISLNQGYTAFGKRYIDPELARIKLGDCARSVIEVLPTLPAGFKAGPISLNTNGELGKGYEAGSILSKSYDIGATPSDADLEKDIHALLSIYMTLSSLYPESLIDLDLTVEEFDFQNAVEKIVLKIEPSPGTKGPQKPPQQTTSKSKARYVRSAEVTARALAMSGSDCALGSALEPHISFISNKTKKNYVEAHHLVPFSQQSTFPISLDVEENIVALCPNCHRLLHHGISKGRLNHLKILLEKRDLELKERGIAVTFESLKLMYRALSSDD
jgi:5-methylcytosine-specific restriction enzyme A